MGYFIHDIRLGGELAVDEAKKETQPPRRNVGLTSQVELTQATELAPITQQRLNRLSLYVHHWP